MKEKNIKKGCNILIMTFTSLEKYVSTPPAPPPLSPAIKVEGIFAPKESPGYGGYLQLNMPIQQIE